MSEPRSKNGSEVKIGTIMRAIFGSTMIAVLGVLWILQSREHQRLQDQITLSRSNCVVLERLLVQDQQDIEALLTRPALMQRIQELQLGLTNITYRQVIRVTNASIANQTAEFAARNRKKAQAPALATAAPR
jgi:response regulator of citrate/malate metabolism